MKKVIPILSIAAVLLLGVSIALAMGILNLPSDPVTASHGPWNLSALGGTIDITLSDVPSGFDVSNGTYAGWCAEDNFQDDFDGPVVLKDSTDSANLPYLDQTTWEQVNYLLNHKAGTAQEVQAALWLLTWGSSNTFPVTPAAQAMYDDAVANGAGFVPGPGQLVAVILYGDGLGAGGYQDTIIEVPVPEPPPPDGEGCTPGFWRNPKRYDVWPVDPSTTFVSVFGVGPDTPMSETIRAKGGDEDALLRHATAAYLNALSGDVDYFYTPAEVIAIVQDAYATGDFTTAKDVLEAQNADDTVCPF